MPPMIGHAFTDLNDCMTNRTEVKGRDGMKEQGN